MIKYLYFFILLTLLLTVLLFPVVPLVTPTNSPEIGARSEAYIPIPEAAANGYISFVQLGLSTQEADSGFGGSLTLDLTRSGAYGRATITWRVIDIDTDSDDLGTSSGVAEIENGIDIYLRTPFSVYCTCTTIQHTLDA